MRTKVRYTTEGSRVLPAKGSFEVRNGERLESLMRHLKRKFPSEPGLLLLGRDGNQLSFRAQWLCGNGSPSSIDVFRITLSPAFWRNT